MLKKLSLIAIALITIANISACNNHKSDNLVPNTPVSSIDIQGISNCHVQKNPLASQITSKLEGYWLWTKRHNPLLNETTNSTKQVLIHFNDAGIFSVTENTRVIAKGTWTLTNINSDTWKLNTSQSSEYLIGDIYLCDNQLMLSNAPVDGLINLFERRN